jgi:hypothetical protein
MNLTTLAIAVDIYLRETDMSIPRHPASDGEYHEIPDLVDQTAREAEDRQVEPQERAPLDYVDQDIPNVAGDVEEERP